MIILTKFGLENVLNKMKIVETTPQSFSDMTAIGYILKDPVYIYIPKHKDYNIRKIEICTEIMVQKLIIGWKIWAIIDKIEKYQYVDIIKFQTIDEYNGYKPKKILKNHNKHMEYLKSLLNKIKVKE